MEDNKPEIQTEKPKRRAPLFAMAFFYIMGFLIIRGDYDTSSLGGVAMVIIGWLFLILSIVLAVIVLFRMFKEHFKKKS